MKKHTSNITFKKRGKSARVRPSQRTYSLAELMRLAKAAAQEKGRAQETESAAKETTEVGELNIACEERKGRRLRRKGNAR